MKIWVAKLILNYDIDEGSNDVYGTYFYVKSDDKNYELNETKEAFIHETGWLINTIPMEIEIRKVYGTYVVEQGFNHFLTDEEELEVKNNMKLALREYLENEKEKILRDYHLKIQALTK